MSAFLFPLGMLVGAGLAFGAVGLGYLLGKWANR